LKGKERSDMMKEIFHLQRFDLASKVGMLQSTRTQLDQLKVPCQDLKRFRRNDFGFRNEVVEGGTELQKKTELVLAETELQQLTIKSKF
jgi:exonuclease SbcC